MSKTNAIGWFDIYVNDMNRAKDFYETLLGIQLESLEDPTGETKMMAFPGDMNAYGSAGALVQSKYSAPGAGGTLVYFLVEDCSTQEKKIENNGGKILRPKFSIGKFGFVTLCEDTEGNKFGLNSMK